MSSTALGSKRAFTLTELLVVIAVIGILAAIIIPVVGNARSSALRSQCSTNIRQIAQGMLLYAAENKNRFPAQAAVEGNASYVWSYNLTRSNLLPARFTGWYCPVHARNDPTLEARTSQWWTTEFPRSYTLCSPLFDAASSGRVGKHVLSIPNPSRVFMLTEWHNASSTLNAHACSVAARDLISSNSLKLVTTTHADGARHYAFVDGHVAYLSLSDANRKEFWMEP